MKKSGKNIEKSRKAVEAAALYAAGSGSTSAESEIRKFDETVEVTLRLGVDPKNATRLCARHGRAFRMDWASRKRSW